jgi:hypothetical protein
MPAATPDSDGPLVAAAKQFAEQLAAASREERQEAWAIISAGLALFSTLNLKSIADSTDSLANSSAKTVQLTKSLADSSSAVVRLTNRLNLLTAILIAETAALIVLTVLVRIG